MSFNHIPPETIRIIKDRANIEEIIGRHVVLKKSGKDFKGLSPFNKEKSPSFYVSPSKKMFKCFSSGHGGDVFKFLQLHLNMTFPEAVRQVAEIVGVRL